MKTDLYTKIVLTIIAACLTFNVLKDIKLIPDARGDSLLIGENKVNLPINHNVIKTNADGSINVRLSEVVRVEPNYGAEFKVKPASSYDQFTVKPSSDAEFTVKPSYSKPFEVKPERNSVFEVKPSSNTVFNVKQVGGSTYSELVNNEENTTVYVNQATKQLSITYRTTEKNDYLSIYDLNGRMADRVLLDPTRNQLTVDISRYGTGIYIYAYSKDSGKFVLK